MKPKFNLEFLPSIKVLLRRLNRYSIVLFLLLLAVVYGFVLFKIFTLADIKPDDSEVASGVKAAAVPHIDQTALQQIQALQDNSVSVQTLFSQARQNPFQE